MGYLCRHVGDMHHAFECAFISLMYYADIEISEIGEREREKTLIHVPFHYSPDFVKNIKCLQCFDSCSDYWILFL